MPICFLFIRIVFKCSFQIRLIQNFNFIFMSSRPAVSSRPAPPPAASRPGRPNPPPPVSRPENPSVPRFVFYSQLQLNYNLTMSVCVSENFGPSRNLKITEVEPSAVSTFNYFTTITLFNLRTLCISNIFFEKFRSLSSLTQVILPELFKSLSNKISCLL